MLRSIRHRFGVRLFTLCGLAAGFAPWSAFAQTPDAIRVAYAAVAATGPGPYCDTMFQKHIPTVSGRPISGSAWRGIWNNLPKPRTKVVMDAAIAGQEPAAPAPVMAPVPNPAPVTAPEPVATRVPAASYASHLNGEHLTNIIPGLSLEVQNAGKPWSLRTGSNGDLRFEVREGDHWPHDGKGTTRRRSEISSITIPAQGYAELDTFIRVEAGPKWNEGVQYIILQAHKGSKDEGDAAGEHPFLALRLDAGGVPILTIAGSTEKPLVRIPPSRMVWRGTQADLSPGVEHYIQVKLMQGPHAWAELWIDGVLKVHYVPGAGESVGYPNKAPPYFKEGVYGANPGRETVVVHHRATTLKLTP